MGLKSRKTEETREAKEMSGVNGERAMKRKERSGIKGERARK